LNPETVSRKPGGGYLRDPRVVFFRFDWRCFAFFLFGLLMMKVPLPRYSALYSFSFAGVSANLFCSVREKSVEHSV
jgi:hypothetical protein